MPQPSLQAFLDALLAIDRHKLGEIATATAAAEPLAAIDELVVPALEEIGERWEQGKVSLSQVYMSGRLCEELFSKLQPGQPGEVAGLDGRDESEPNQPLRIAISTLDDYHLLGKRMVAAVLRASGYPLQDYGTANAASLATWVQRDRIQVLLLSVLMLPSALRVQELRKLLDAAGVQVQLLVGGAPFRFDPNLWREVGADGTGASAADALALVRAAEETLT